jgi:hypothetical protein
MHTIGWQLSVLSCPPTIPLSALQKYVCSSSPERHGVATSRVAANHSVTSASNKAYLAHTSLYITYPIDDLCRQNMHQLAHSV